MIKNLTFFTGSEFSKKFFLKQLREYIPDEIEIIIYAVNVDTIENITSDLLIFSSQIVLEEMKASGLFHQELYETNPLKDYIVCNRTINIDYIDEVLQIPLGSEVFFVNDVLETASICISHLLELGIDHITYVPYYPGASENPEIEVAITAGESQFVPSYCKKVIDLGPRVIDAISMYRIVEKVGMIHFDATNIMKKYLQKIINISKKLADTNDQVEILKNSVRHRLKEKGHFAKHSFDHIVGKSKALTESIERAKKLAETELTILIEGESGTGKELFASAIHNHSHRKDGPFLAANFSALPEELVESELFGYEEGAFTGAKKGGKIGLFELAEGGTIFLDEVGDISPKVQTRLLRVLQEKEIMPIGGGKIKKVDIRIIAATNKNLKEMAKNNQFRSDLYYRLKIGCIYIPPLRDRKEDIRDLVYYFIKAETKKKIPVNESVFKEFEKYAWHGNVREISSTIQYMLAISKKEELEFDDLPDENFFEMTEDDSIENKKYINIEFDNFTKLEEKKRELDAETETVLWVIYKLQEEAITCSRERIVIEMQKTKFNLTENQVRNRLKILEENEYIYKNKGKRGTILRKIGKNYIEQREQGKFQ